MAHLNSLDPDEQHDFSDNVTPLAPVLVPYHAIGTGVSTKWHQWQITLMPELVLALAWKAIKYPKNYYINMTKAYGIIDATISIMWQETHHCHVHAKN